MRLEDCFQLGHISRIHGYKGSVVAFFDTDRPEAYTALESVFLEDRGELIPFFIEDLAQNSKGHFILKFEEVDDEASALNLVGSELWLPLSVLPPLEGKSFYYHEIVGFELWEKEQKLGICKSVLDSSAQPLLVMDYQGREVLIPAIDEFIVSIDRDAQRMNLSLPEGLLSING